jgi:hypothetical protein
MVPVSLVSWVSIDFEWYAAPGALPVPRLLTAIESDSGKLHRIPHRELETMRRPPFALGPDTIVCAYSLAADLVAWLVLGWELPARAVCTYAETRVRYNGIRSEFDDDLLGACARRNIAYSEARETKDYWHGRFADPAPLSLEEEVVAFEYGLADTKANLRLAQDYEPDMGWQRALQFGEYCKAAATIEYNGVGMYVEPLTRLQRYLKDARLALIEEGDRNIGCYDKGHLRSQLVWAFAQRHGIPWQSTPSGLPVLADEELKVMGVRYPIVEQFRQLKKTVGALRRNKYAAGRTAAAIPACTRSAPKPAAMPRKGRSPYGWGRLGCAALCGPLRDML